MQQLRELLENWQVSVYFGTVLLATIIAMCVPRTTVLEAGVNPALAFMLFVTFLQVPLLDLGRAFTKIRFFAALFVTNFIIVPLLVAVLVQFLPPDPIVLLGVLLVLFTPCIDYVVTFSHLGRANAHLILAATPTLLLVQMILLPVYLGMFLGKDATGLVQLSPFVHAFIWLIIVPFILAAVVQFGSTRSGMGKWLFTILGFLPVPATALVLFIVIAAVVPQLGAATDAVFKVLPIYIAFATLAPFLGWLVGRLFRLEVASSRAIAFSASTRNSLVVLPLALAVPGAIPVLPAIIITQTLVELLSELIYIRLIPKLIR